MTDACSRAGGVPQSFWEHAEKVEFRDWKLTRQWWTKKTYGCLVGVKVSGDVCAREAFRATLSEILTAPTNPGMTAAEERIWTGLGLDSWPTSKPWCSQEGAQSLPVDVDYVT